MSTAVLRTAPARGPIDPHHLVGTGTLLRFTLRRDRRGLATWVLALGGLAVYTASALRTVYPTAHDRQARAAVMGNPAAVLLSGPGYGRDNYTLGAMIANELALTVTLAAAVMSIRLVVRHTRAEEELGRADLVRAGVVGRRAPLTAALSVVALANAAVAVVVAAGLVGSGLAAVDAIALAAGIALTGMVFGAVAAVTAQLSQYTRAASGAAFAVLAIAAADRGIGDAVRPGGSPLSWFSPIAWAQQTRAFVDLRWWPLLLSVVLIAVLIALGYRLVGVRDLGAGLLQPRPGPANASGLLRGPFGLSVRLQRGAIAGWASALLLLGVVFGSLTDQVTSMVADNAKLASLLDRAAGASVADSFAASTALYLALGVAGFAVGSVLRLRGEETAGRAEVLLAHALDRRRFAGGGLAVTVAGSILLLVAAGLGTGLAAAVVSGEPGRIAGLLGALLVPLPAVLVVAGAVAALVGVAPCHTSLAWGVLGWAVFAGYFGTLLNLPTWALRLSPFGWLPTVPAERLDVVPLAGLTLLAAALFTVALAGFRRRDIMP